MADLDDLREGCNFGLGVASTNNSFHVKGAEHLPWGMKDRLSRIFNPKTGRTVMLAFDHGFIMGPTSGLERIDLNIVPLIEYADCLMCTRGILHDDCGCRRLPYYIHRCCRQPCTQVPGQSFSERDVYFCCDSYEPHF